VAAVRNRAAGGAGLLVVGVLFGVFTAVLSTVAVAGLAGLAGAAATSAQTAQAKKALLELSDLPAGWTSSPSSSSGAGSFSGAPQLASCIGVPTQLIVTTPPEVDSPQFENRGGTQIVQDSISIYPSAKYARQEFAAVSSRKTPGCISALLNDVSGSGLAGGFAGSASVKRLPSASGTAAFSVDTTVKAQGRAGTHTHLELVYLVRGQWGDALTLLDVGSSPSPALVAHLVSVAQSRL